MTASHIVPYATLFLAAFTAGIVNSIAGGGTLLTFPALLAVGITPIAANATSTLALVPGSASAAWGYRDDFRGQARWVLALAVPSVIGGGLGALAVLRAGDRMFARLVPWLILTATLLFVAQGPLSNWLRRRAESRSTTPVEPQSPRLFALMLFQFFVALYGGFFGAGIGILMLAALGLSGFTDVHRMNALKNVAAVCCNGIAAITFVIDRKVRWPLALLMATGAISGGFVGARLAKRVGPRVVRVSIVGVGLGITAIMFWRQFH